MSKLPIKPTIWNSIPIKWTLNAHLQSFKRKR